MSESSSEQTAVAEAPSLADIRDHYEAGGTEFTRDWVGVLLGMVDQQEQAIKWLQDEISGRNRRVLAYDVPIRVGMTVRLTLPMDLTVDEAERIARIVRTVAFEDQR